MKRHLFRASDLAKIAAAESFQHPSESLLRIGSIIQLNSGGPKMMVVDYDGINVLAAWRDSEGAVQEGSFPPACVHRVSPL
jgi:uncharacterized protein YodC (DUF2158 family)